VKRGLYTTVVLALFHGLLLFAALNLAAWGFLEAFPEDPVSLTYGNRSFGLVYPGRSPEDVRALLRETWTRPEAYEPFTGSRERRYAGRFVNVHAAGFRLSRDQGPWPPDAARANVFVFGGSTTFGYGVADDETIVSALQASLDERLGRSRAACYNFGRGAYYSTGERILFENLLGEGASPRVAVFVDGLNEFALGAPFLSGRFREQVNAPVRSAIATLVEQLPLAQLVARRKAARPPRRSEAEIEAAFDDATLLDARLERYLANRRLISATASAWGVQRLFVWQPVPTYGYDRRYHLFGDLDFDKNSYAGFGYRRMAERLRRAPPGPDFLWAADLQEGVQEALYVDQIHYTAAFSRRIGAEIARALVERGLVP
jgi:hypothetical protein